MGVLEPPGDDITLSTDGKALSGSKDVLDDGVGCGDPKVSLLGAGDIRLGLDCLADVIDGVHTRSWPKANAGGVDGVERGVPEVVILGTGVVILGVV
jgi:hypothetical protein